MVRIQEGFGWLCLAKVSKFALHFKEFALKAKLQVCLRVTVDNGKGIHGWGQGGAKMAVGLSLI